MTTQAPARTIDLGPVSQVPMGEGRVFQIAQASVAVFRSRDGRLYATQDRCPHRGGPLADGIVGGGKVVCPLHAYRYDLVTGQPLGHECAALITYPVSLGKDGHILLGI